MARKQRDALLASLADGIRKHKVKAKPKYKTPGVVDHPERLAARKAAVAAKKAPPKPKVYKTVGIIDHPGRYRKTHPNEKLRSWKDPSGHWRAVRAPVKKKA